MVASLSPEKSLHLVVNPHYHGDPPRMPRIEARVVRDANARALMLVGGSADLMLNGLRPDLVDSIAERSRVEVDAGPGVVLTYLLMNNTDEALSDPRVRKAVAHAIDRERIVAVKLGGRGAMATGLMPEGHWAHEPDVVRYRYDPARARQLLDAAGYPRKPGGGARLQLALKISNDQFRMSVARVIAAQLGEVGIDVAVRSFDSSLAMDDIKRGNYQLGMLRTPPIADPNYYYTYFHSSRMPDPKTLYGHNRWRYRNPRVDALCEQGRAVADRDKRFAIYSEVQKILARDLPMLPLWHRDNVVIRNVDVSGFGILPNGTFRGLTTADKRR
jgi:peptide/nickel transport system substrate-binding protein